MHPRPRVMDLKDPHIAIRRKGDLDSVCAHCNALKNRKNYSYTHKKKKKRERKSAFSSTLG